MTSQFYLMVQFTTMLCCLYLVLGDVFYSMGLQCIQHILDPLFSPTHSSIILLEASKLLLMAHKLNCGKLEQLENWLSMSSVLSNSHFYSST